jgi:hypothetical protein
MVRKLFAAALAAPVFILGIQFGCNQTKNPVVPANSAVLQLVLPAKIMDEIATAKLQRATRKLAISDLGVGALEYNLIADGEAPVTGVIMFDGTTTSENVFINLPKAGEWVVAAEWFSISNPAASVKKATAKLTVGGGLTATAEFAGADKVNVQGTTSFTLNMEDIHSQESVCYNANLTDSTNCDFNLNGGWLDLYSFNTGTYADSVSAGTTGDIQALYDAVSNSTYLGVQTITGTSSVVPPSNYIYLGNGDLVNYPVIPTNAVYYPNTLVAKSAVVGQAAATIAVNDIFAVKVPSTHGMAWVQVWIDNPDCGTTNTSLMQFWFIYNNEGLNYMKFDQTTYGQSNCNLNPIPTP